MSEIQKLPQGWEFANLFDLCQPKQWRTISIKDLLPEGYTVYGANGIIGFYDEYTNEKPTLMITCRGASCGNIHLSQPYSYINGNAMALDELEVDACDIHYLKNFLSQYDFNDIISGTAQPQITQTNLKKVFIPIAPINEQTRIGNKLEELLSDLDNGVTELKAAQTKLTQYRQSLLKSAVEGSLTQQWRETHKPEETGSQLLERILKERRQHWVQKKLAEFKEKDKKLPKDWQKKYPEPVEPDTSDLNELPTGWVWATIDQLAVEKRYGSSSKTNDNVNGIPVLRMGNIQEGEIDYSKLKFLPKIHSEFPALLLKDGDLLFNRTNSPELVGKTAIYRDIGKPCSYASYLISVTFSETFMPDLAAFFINSILGKAWILSVVNQTAGQANVNGTKLGALAIPLPPIGEQKEIVDKAKTTQQEIKSQLEVVELSLKQLEVQRKNILKSAFSGELVEQNPNDEPASLLLERIKEKREEQAKLVKAKRVKKKSNETEKIMKTLREVLLAEDDWIDAQEAFRLCGVSDGTDTERIEELYAELRRLDKEKVLDTKRVGDYDQIRLKSKP